MPATAVGLTVLPALPGAANDNAILGPKHWAQAKMDISAAAKAKQIPDWKPARRIGLGKLFAAYSFYELAKDYVNALDDAMGIAARVEKFPSKYWVMDPCNSSCYPGDISVSALLSGGIGCCLDILKTTWAANPVPDPYPGGGGVVTLGGHTTSSSVRWKKRAVIRPAVGAPVPTPVLATMPEVLPLADPALDPLLNPEAPFRPAVNPNVTKVTGPAVQPLELPNGQQGVNPFTGQDMVAQPLPNLRWEMQVGPSTVPPLAPRPTGKKPPDKNTKEKKTKSSGAAAAAVFAALDVVSEASEVVDAIYDALPDDVKKATKQKGRGLIDQAGQYGIDGADWKAQAIWDNFDKVDWNKALSNVIANEIQDQALGNIHKNTPKNTGSALDGGFKAVNKGIEGVFSAFGL